MTGPTGPTGPLVGLAPILGVSNYATNSIQLLGSVAGSLLLNNTDISYNANGRVGFIDSSTNVYAGYIRMDVNRVPSASSTVGYGSSDTTFNIDSDADMTITTRKTKIDVGNSGYALNLRGNVDIPTRFTLNNGDLVFYGGTGFDSKTASYTIPSTGLNIQYYLIVSGTTVGQTITMPIAKGGYNIYIINASTQTWNITVNNTTTDKIYGSYGGISGQTTIPLVVNKSLIFIQATGVGFFIISESVYNTPLIVQSVQNSSPNSQFYLRSTTNGIQQFGNITTGGATVGTFNFPKAYTTAPIVVLTVNNGSASNNTATIASVSGTSINWHIQSTASGGINYMAIGSALVVP